MTRKNKDPERDPAERAAGKVQVETLVGQHGPLLDADLADKLTEEGSTPAAERVAELRVKVGFWLPGPREKPARGRAASGESVRVRSLLLDCAEQVRTTLQDAGRARAAAFRGAGFDPADVVAPIGGETTTRGKAAVLDTRAFTTALDQAGHDVERGEGRVSLVPHWPYGRASIACRLRRRTVEIREMTTAGELGVPAGPEHTPTGPAGEEAGSWEWSLVALHAAWAAMNLTIAEHLPRPRRLADRLAQTWHGLALDRFYYRETDTWGDLARMEETAWTLVRVLPAARVPRHAPGLLLAGHRSWIERWLRDHDDELKHLVNVGAEVETIRRGGEQQDRARKASRR